MALASQVHYRMRTTRPPRPQLLESWAHFSNTEEIAGLEGARTSNAINTGETCACWNALLSCSAF
jgi:hypothetical protein